MSDTLKNNIIIQKNTSKILDLDILTEQTKQLAIIEKTKQIAYVERTKQEVEKTKQAIEKTKQYELKIQLEKIKLAFIEYEFKKQEIQYLTN
jgi:hypothetical protein